MRILVKDSGHTVAVNLSKTRVILMPGRYTPERTEPVFDSKYECIGTIMVIYSRDSEYQVKVEWDNGEANKYNIEDLRAVETLDIKNPNFTFRQNKHNNSTLSASKKSLSGILKSQAKAIKKLRESNSSAEKRWYQYNKNREKGTGIDVSEIGKEPEHI